MIIAIISLFAFSILMIFAALKDAATMTIPNWISLAIIAAYFVALPFTWQGGAVFLEHLSVGLVFFLAGFAMFAFGWLGGGDAKLMAATALWWTWPDALNYIFYTALAGGALGLFLLAGRQYIPVKVLTSPWAYKMLKDEKKMPYGIALAIGGVLTLIQSDIYRTVLGG